MKVIDEKIRFKIIKLKEKEKPANTNLTPDYPLPPPAPCAFPHDNNNEPGSSTPFINFVSLHVVKVGWNEYR